MFSRTILADSKTEKIATHQRLVRAASKQVKAYLPKGAKFPTAKQINYFEGKNGPDGLGTKKSKEEDIPCQFLLPENDDGRLVGHIRDHLHEVHEAYKKRDEIKLSFELAWLEHMIVDGLTPAHHYPFKEEVDKLSKRDRKEVDNLMKRLFLSGDGILNSIEVNWKHIGPKGVGSSHILYEAGIDFIAMSLRARQLIKPITAEDIKKAKNGQFVDLYYKSVYKIADMKMFDKYMKSGWTTELANSTREVLLPEAVKCITLGWIAGIYEGK